MKTKPLLALLCSALLLQGCIPALVGGGAAIVTKTASDPRSVGTQVDDTTLGSRVSSALSKDEQLKKEARVVVTAYKGVVLLTGQATPELAQRALHIAQGVEDIGKVHNEIRRGTPITLGTASNDTWITTQIRTKLLTSNAVKSSNVTVTTENSEVFLLGVVTRREGRAAAEIASNISGVTKVTTAFTYLD